MKVLVINSGKSMFIVDDNQYVSPEDISREDLLKILNDIYEKSNNEEVEIPSKIEIEMIKNPVEKEIVQQIIQKISDFKYNVENIRQELQISFPDIKCN
ncbi:hypothetical protein [Enterococcus faecalis]|uniref:hypothetical protein n=1 Tax=Enterococcus faecalis TaxID=1351 RepID=UPI00045AA932|nr:hypothetical protein [Enterococcus faecalis]KAJ84725.1 hypothetical protein P791_1673 [Enterococcus faecalis NY9]